MKILAFSLLTTASLTMTACTIDVHGDGGAESIIREQKHIALTGMPNVTIRTFDGSIELRSWDRNEILLDIERRAETMAEARDLVVETTEADGNVRIETKRPPRHSGGLIHFMHFGWSSPSVRLTVTVPRHLTVEAHSGDGNILARDLAGRIELRTGDGAVDLRNLDGDVQVNTGDGLIRATDLKGSLAVTTGDGAMDVSGRFDNLRAHSGDGSITVDARPGSTARGEWNISSGDGSVMLRLPPDFNATLDAHTGDGGITTTGVTVTSPPEAREHGSLRGQIGVGGAPLILRTGDGPINIVAR